MPRVGRVVLPNYPHHVVQRGHNRQVVFAAEEDYQRYAANARRVGAQLRVGENTKRALRKLEEVE